MTPERILFRVLAWGLAALALASTLNGLRREPPPEGSSRMGEIRPCGRAIQKGDLVVMVSIGAGYLYGAVAFVQAY